MGQTPLPPIPPPRDSGKPSGGFVAPLLVALAFALAVVGLIVGLWFALDTGPAGPSLEERANSACGRDRVVKFDHSGSGFARREQVAVTCRRPDGSVYVRIETE